MLLLNGCTICSEFDTYCSSVRLRTQKAISAFSNVTPVPAFTMMRSGALAALMESAKKLD